jgi:hypothetical protein
MALALRARIVDRYAMHSNVLRYLHSGFAASSEFGDPMTSAAIKKFVQRLLMRLDKAPTPSTEAASEGRSSPAASSLWLGLLGLSLMHRSQSIWFLTNYATTEIYIRVDLH